MSTGTSAAPTAGQLHFEDVAVGDEVPALAVVVDETQMFFFSAATYNGHRIHYDKDWARERGGLRRRARPGPAAGRPAGPRGHRLDRRRRTPGQLRGRRTAPSPSPARPLTFGGRVTGTRVEDGRGLVELEIAGRRGDDVLMPGTATVSLPLRGDAG